MIYEHIKYCPDCGYLKHSVILIPVVSVWNCDCDPEVYRESGPIPVEPNIVILEESND